MPLDLPGTPDKDRALVRAALTGTTAALTKLARRLARVECIVAAQARRHGFRLQPEELQDVSQEAMLRIWSKLPAFEGRASLETWFYRFCYLELMNFRRNRNRQLRPLSDFGDAVPEPVAPPTLPRSDLDHLLRHISAREAQVVRLRHVEQLEFGEIAEVLAVSPSTAKTLYYRGIDKLRKVVCGATAETA